MSRLASYWFQKGLRCWYRYWYWSITAQKYLVLVETNQSIHKTMSTMTVALSTSQNAWLAWRTTWESDFQQVQSECTTKPSEEPINSSMRDLPGNRRKLSRTIPGCSPRRSVLTQSGLSHIFSSYMFRVLQNFILWIHNHLSWSSRLGWGCCALTKGQCPIQPFYYYPKSSEKCTSKMLLIVFAGTRPNHILPSTKTSMHPPISVNTLF